MKERNISFDESNGLNTMVLCVIEGGQQTFLDHPNGVFALITPCLVWGPEQSAAALRELTRLESAPAQPATFGMTVDFDRRRLTLMTSYMDLMPPHGFMLIKKIFAKSWRGYEFVSAANYSDFLTLSQLHRNDSVSDDRRVSVTAPVEGNGRGNFTELLDTWISVLVEPGKYIHLLETNIDARLADEGIKFIESCDSYDEPPDEIDISRGMLVDPIERVIYSWGSRLSAAAVAGLNNDEVQWNVDRIPVDGYRWQLMETCDSEVVRAECLASDPELLAQSLVNKIRNPKFSIVNLGTKVTFFSNKIFYSGFGCLAITILIPFLLVMFLTGYWKSGMTVYGIVIGFLFLIATLKFRDIKSRFGDFSSRLQQSLLPKWPGPDTEEAFEEQLDALLKNCDLPPLAEIEKALEAQMAQ